MVDAGSEVGGHLLAVERDDLWCGHRGSRRAGSRDRGPKPLQAQGTSMLDFLDADFEDIAGFRAGDQRRGR